MRTPGCTTGEQLGGMPITATLPNPDHAAASDPVVIAGSVEPAAASLSLVLADGPTIAVPFGAPHFYVTDLTGSDAAEVRADGVTVVARDTSGHELARLTVPADWEASAADEASQATIDITSGVTDGLYDLQVITTDKSGNTLTSALISNVRARTRRLMT